MRVLLISADRRFRHTAALLLSRRGCTVTLGEVSDDVGELVVRHDAEVVVLDAGRSLTAAARSVAAIETLTPPVGVVIVANEARGIVNLPVLDRWGSFDELFTSVSEAYRDRALHKSLVERG
jgi:DNA-binding NtrC family response regulator